MCESSTPLDLLGAYNLPMFGPPCESVCDQIEVPADAVKAAEGGAE